SHKKALSTNPGNPAYTRELRRCYLTTAELLLVAREYEPAARVADDVVHNFPATVESFADAATVLRWCVDVGDEEGLPAEFRRDYVRRIIARLREVCRRASEQAATPEERARLARMKEALAASLTNHPDGPADVAEAVLLAGEAVEGF